MIAGTSMNSGKTYAATELIKQATRAGLRVAAGKLSGIACLRDTLNMADHGAVTTASFLDCGLPSTVEIADLAPSAKAIIARLNDAHPDLIVIELGEAGAQARIGGCAGLVDECGEAAVVVLGQVDFWM